MKLSKRDLIYSLILGEVSAWCLISVIKNPYIEEIKQLYQTFPAIESLVWTLPIILPILFVIGIVLAEYLKKVIKIIYQIVRFAEVGVLNTVIDFGILNLLIWTTGITKGLSIGSLNTISFLSATANSYFWNKFWTFEEKKKASGKQFTQFLIVSGIGIGINTGIVVAATSLISPWFGFSPGMWANVAKVLATLVSMVWNFIGYKFIVFKK